MARMPKVQLFETFADLAAAMAPYEVWASADLPARPSDGADAVMEVPWTVAAAGAGRVSVDGPKSLRVVPPPAGVVGLLLTVAGRGLCIPWAVPRQPASCGLVAVGAGQALEITRSSADFESLILQAAPTADAIPDGLTLTLGPVGLYVAAEGGQ